MSLTRVIQDFFELPEKQAQALVELIALDKSWKIHTWKLRGTGEVRTGNPAEIKTQGDLIEYMQTMGQGSFFGGHDRTQFKEGKATGKEAYFEKAKELGLVETMSYADAKVEAAPDYIAVHGSSESQVKIRLAALKADLLSAKIPLPNSGIIYALGTDSRELGRAVTETEAESADRLTQAGKPTHELAMVELLTNDLIAELKATGDSRFAGLRCVPINAKSVVKDRATGTTATTSDTVQAMKASIECESDVKAENKPVIVAFYSAQPFGWRQHDDTRVKMGERYKVVTCAPALAQDTFIRHPKAVTLLLSEMARRVHTAYTARQELLHQLHKTPLTEIQQGELHGLIQMNSTPELQTLFGKKSNGIIYRQLLQAGLFRDDKVVGKDKDSVKRQWFAKAISQAPLSRDTFRQTLVAEFGADIIRSKLRPR